MKKASLKVNLPLLAVLMVSGKVFSQGLPDEINHPQYLKIYQSLKEVLIQKTTELNNLLDQKAEVEKIISQMEKDQIEIPARNQELKRILEVRRDELQNINTDILGVEGILGKLVEDLQRLNNTISQYQRDVNDLSNRANQIQSNRNAIAQNLAQLDARLQREINEENQSIQVLNRLTGELNASLQRRQEVERERALLIRDVERFKVDIVQSKNQITKNNATLITKKNQLAELQTKLPVVKTELSAEEAKLSQLDASLAPKKTQLANLRATLAKLSPEITRLQAESKSMGQKISANQTRITSLNVDPLIARRDSLESDISGVKERIKQNTDAQAVILEKIKPVMSEINDLNSKMKEALRTRNLPEAARLKKQIDELAATIQADQAEIQKIQRESDKLALSIAARQNEINSLMATIDKNRNLIANLEADNVSLRSSIEQNEKKITELSQSNLTLAQQIATLDAEVKVLETQRAPIVTKVSSLKLQETQLSTQINTLTKEIAALETDNKNLTVAIADMEKTISDFPQNLRRLDAHLRSIDEKLPELRSQLNREERLLARIRQDRMSLEAERSRVVAALDQTNAELAETERMLMTVNNRMNEEVRTRDALLRYNQESFRKLEALKNAKASNEKEIASATEELRINEQDLATIARELPGLKVNAADVSKKVEVAEMAQIAAKRNADSADNEYQNRLSLYQRYLSAAQTIGSDQAKSGEIDGAKAGVVDSKTLANKLASENASLEAKWEALRRGYVRGEISGYRIGFETGLSSTTDAERGELEGRMAGARRAKDHANMVIKPEKYLEEFGRRLKEDEVSFRAPLVKSLVSQELRLSQAMLMEQQQVIPALTKAELLESEKILTSLDNLIAQSEVELREVLSQRSKLSDVRNVYQTPGDGENANNVNCSSVYKGVRDFIDACKGSYTIRYQSLFNTAHLEAFKRDYSANFQQQIDRVFESELARFYPNYLKEATTISREAGLVAGKKETYDQSFSRAENAAFAGNLPSEINRVEGEARRLVQEHLNQNPALTIKNAPRLSTSSIFGISPGIDASMKILMKNVGAEASQGNSFVRVTEASNNLLPERRESPLASVAGRSALDLTVMKVKVSDSAQPGSKAFLVGEIIHPGNHYRSSRVETFRIETTIGVNPAVESLLNFDKTPKVASIFGTKKHEIEVSLKPLFSGVNQGYEIVLEEIGSTFMSIVSLPERTEVLGRNMEKKVKFIYKLNKASRGKNLVLKVSIKNDGVIVSEQQLQIMPE
jgi:chromosome segregation ATPase